MVHKCILFKNKLWYTKKTIFEICYIGNASYMVGFFVVCFLCAGTSSLVPDTQSQTQLVWTYLPSFQHTLRTPNQMQMRVCNTVIKTHTTIELCFCLQNKGADPITTKGEIKNITNDLFIKKTVLTIIHLLWAVHSCNIIGVLLHTQRCFEERLFVWWCVIYVWIETHQRLQFTALSSSRPVM